MMNEGTRNIKKLIVEQQELLNEIEDTRTKTKKLSIPLRTAGTLTRNWEKALKAFETFELNEVALKEKIAEVPQEYWEKMQLTRNVMQALNEVILKFQPGVIEKWAPQDSTADLIAKSAKPPDPSKLPIRSPQKLDDVTTRKQQAPQPSGSLGQKEMDQETPTTFFDTTETVFEFGNNQQENQVAGSGAWQSVQQTRLEQMRLRKNADLDNLRNINGTGLVSQAGLRNNAGGFRNNADDLLSGMTNDLGQGNDFDFQATLMESARMAKMNNTQKMNQMKDNQQPNDYMHPDGLRRSLPTVKQNPILTTTTTAPPGFNGGLEAPQLNPQSELVQMMMMMLNQNQAGMERMFDKIDSASAYKPQRLRMPEVELPTFSGDFKEFKSFCDMFNSIIDRTNLPAIEKLQLLKSRLKESAFRAVEHLNATDENYDVAWCTLNRMYDSKVVQLAAVIDAITSNEMPDRSNPESMLAHMQIWCSAFNNLDGMDLKWEDIVVYLILQTFDDDTRGRFEDKRGSDTTVPSRQFVREFQETEHKIMAKLQWMNVLPKGNDNKQQSLKRSETTRTHATLDSEEAGWDRQDEQDAHEYQD